MNRIYQAVLWMFLFVVVYHTWRTYGPIEALFAAYIIANIELLCLQTKSCAKN